MRLLGQVTSAVRLTEEQKNKIIEKMKACDGGGALKDRVM